MAIHFGTDGWRAVIADEFTFASVGVVARAYARLLRDVVPDRRPRVVVGFDRRFASDQFARVAASQLARCGVDVILAKRALPSPAVSWAVVNTRSDGGFIVTASHNPAPYNGIKLKSSNGASLSPSLYRRVEILLEDAGNLPVETAGEITQVDLIDSYLERLSRVVPLDRLKGAGLTVVVDAMFGASAGVVPRLLGGDSTETVEINTAHNPLFPGLTGPEPIEKNLARLKKVVTDGRATMGLAFDGDGDRLGLVDDRGEYVSTQVVLALLARYLLDVRKERRPIVKSVTGSTMIDRLAAQASVPVIETPTGFPWIASAMLEHGAALGGEESGGYAFGFHLPERDGILAAILLLEYTIQSGQHLSELLTDLEDEVGSWRYRRIDLQLTPEVAQAVAARLSAIEWPASVAGLNLQRVKQIDGTKLEFQGGSWLLIRFSGTEPLLRIYAESSEPDLVEALLIAARDLLSV